MSDLKIRPIPSLAGKFYWPTDDYSIPADHLCWHVPPSPDADFRCIRQCGHHGRHHYKWSPIITDHSHRAAYAALQAHRARKDGEG